MAFGEFAEIYAALGAQGISQRQADETQLQVIGAMLGLHRTDNDQKQDGEGLVVARMRHARGEGPKPEPKAPDAAAMGAFIGRARSARG